MFFIDNTFSVFKVESGFSSIFFYLDSEEIIKSSSISQLSIQLTKGILQEKGVIFSPLAFYILVMRL